MVVNNTAVKFFELIPMKTWARLVQRDIVRMIFHSFGDAVEIPVISANFYDDAGFQYCLLHDSLPATDWLESWIFLFADQIGSALKIV